MCMQIILTHTHREYINNLQFNRDKHPNRNVQD